MEGGVAFRNKNYHKQCFICKGGCGRELGGAEFGTCFQLNQSFFTD